MIPELAPYTALIEAFVEERIRPLEFESLYLRLFKNDPTMWPQEIFQVLNRLFSDVDAYFANATLRGPDNLDEEQLRRRAEEALKRLQEVIEGGS